MDFQQLFWPRMHGVRPAIGRAQRTGLVLICGLTGFGCSQDADTTDQPSEPGPSATSPVDTGPEATAPGSSNEGPMAGPGNAVAPTNPASPATGTAAQPGQPSPSPTEGPPAPGTTPSEQPEGPGNEELPGDPEPTAPTDVAPNEPAPTGELSVENVEVVVHEQVNTILVVTWTQVVESDEVWLEFSFENDDVMRSRAQPGTAGEHRDVVLGVPGDTEVEIRIVSQTGGVEASSEVFTGTTDPVPAGMPLPDVLGYEADLSSPERWMLASVENSTGNLPADYLLNTFWVYIMDRQGRIVWYYADPASNATMSFQRVAKDGDYIWIEKRPFGQAGTRGVLKMTLDWEYFEEIPVDGLADCIDITEDGALLYDASDQLRERDAGGNVRTIFDCRDHFGGGFNCYTNTINYNEADDTILMSYPEPNTVIQVRRSDGEVVGQYGDAPGSWDFAPPLSSPPSEWGFGFQHFPNITTDGTLLISSHLPGFEGFTTTPGEYQHAFIEFEIDQANEQLVEVWRYTDAPEWPRSRGMVIKLDNGNYLGNYGTHGVIREITPDGQTVFHVKFDHDGNNDFFNKLLGNNEYIADLYSLNGGPAAGGAR